MNTEKIHQKIQKTIKQFTPNNDLNQNQILTNILNSHETTRFNQTSALIEIQDQDYLRIFIFYSIIRRKFELNQFEEIQKNFTERYKNQNPFPELFDLQKLNEQHQQIYYLTDFMLRQKEQFLLAYYKILEQEYKLMQDQFYHLEKAGYNIQYGQYTKMLKEILQNHTLSKPCSLGECELFCLNQAFCLSFTQLTFWQNQQNYLLEKQNFIYEDRQEILLTWILVQQNQEYQVNDKNQVFVLLGETNPKNQAN